MSVTQETIDNFLIKHKGKVWDSVKTKRYNKYYDNITTTKGTWQVDMESLESIRSAIDLLTSEIDTMGWKDVDNNIVELTKTELLEILTIYNSRRISVFNASLNVKSDIDDVTNIDDLYLLDIDSIFNAYIDV